MKNLLTTTLLLALTGILCAVDTFTATSDNKWTTAGNWSSGVPTATTDVLIPSGQVVVISGSSPVTTQNITVDGNLTIADPDGAQILIAGNLAVSGTITVGSGGNQGQLSFTDLAPSISGSGTISFSDTVPTSSLIIAQTADLTVNNTSLTGNNWAIRQESGDDGGTNQGEMILNATLSIPNSSSISIYDRIKLTNNGIINLNPTSTIICYGDAEFYQSTSGRLNWTLSGSSSAAILFPGVADIRGTIGLTRQSGFNPNHDEGPLLVSTGTILGTISPVFSNTGFDVGDFAATSSGPTGARMVQLAYQPYLQNLAWSGTVPTTASVGGSPITLSSTSDYSGTAITYTIARVDAGVLTSSLGTPTPTTGSPSSVQFTPGSAGEIVRITARATSGTSGILYGNAEIYTDIAVLQPQTVTDTTTYPSPIYYGDALSLTGTSTSGGTLTWATNNTAKLSITGSSASVIGIGSGVTVTASAPATSIFNAGSSTPTALSTILAKPVTVTVNGGTRAYGQANPAPILTIPTLVGSDSLGAPIYSGPGATADATTAPGTYAISATFPNPNYNVTATGSLTITQATTVITLLDVTTLYQPGDTATLVATASPTVSPITFSSGNTAIATVSGNTITAVSTGTVTITANFAGDANYAASSTNITVTIGQQVQTLTFPTIGSLAVGATRTVVATSSASLTPITYASSNTAIATVNASTGVITGVAVGTATITASQAGNPAYTAATATQTVTVTAAPPVVTPPAVSGGGCGAGSGIALLLSLTGLSLLLRRRSL